MSLSKGGLVRTSPWIAALLVAGVSHGCLLFAQERAGAGSPGKVPAPQAGVPTNPSALALQDFKARIDAYVALHKKEESAGVALKKTNDPAEISAAEKILAARIRAARANAKPGDIFTPEIRAEFRKLIAQPMKGDAKADARQIVKDDAPASMPLKVNADYPEGAPLPTVPVSVLRNLPTLPAELEYRIIGGHLILRDTNANLVVDFIPDAMR
jgi:hypothetical protein